MYLLLLGFFLLLTSVYLVFLLTPQLARAGWLVPDVLLFVFSYSLFSSQISSIWTLCLLTSPILGTTIGH